MASLFRKCNASGVQSPFWYAAFDYRGKDGRVRRVKRSTKIRERVAAMRLAHEWEKTAHKAAKGALTQDASRRFVSSLMEEFTGEKMDLVTIAEQFNGWLKNGAASLAPKSVERYGKVVRDFLAFMGTRVELGIEHLRQDDLVRFRDDESKAGKSSSTCNLSIKILGAALNDAVRRGLRSDNPAAFVKSIEADDAMERKPFEASEIEALLRAAPCEEWRCMIALGLYTGGRIGDLAGLRWEDVDLQQGVIRFKPRKTKRHGKEVAIPILSPLNAFLLRLPSSDDAKTALFPVLSRKETSGNHGLSLEFGRVMALAGVGAGREASRAGKGRLRSSRSFHSLRHSNASLMANAGVSEEVRMKVTGHTTGEMHARYTHIELGTMREGLATLPDFSGILADIQAD